MIKMKKYLIAATVVLVTLLITMYALSKVRNLTEDGFVGEVETAAEDLFHGLDDYITQQTEENGEQPFENALYRATLHQSAQTVDFMLLSDKNVIQTLTFSDLNLDPKFFEHDIYYILNVRNGTIREISACRKDILSEDSLKPSVNRVPGEHITLFQFCLLRYIAYYSG